MLRLIFEISGDTSVVLRPTNALMFRELGLEVATVVRTTKSTSSRPRSCEQQAEDWAPTSAGGTESTSYRFGVYRDGADGGIAQDGFVGRAM